MKYLLGIDFGGGASKATLLSEKGKVVSESTAEYPTIYTDNGGCEQNPNDWIKALCENVKAVLESVDAKDIKAIAIDSATHTFLPCDSEFRPLRNAIHWTDSRSKKESEKLLKEYGDMIYEKTFHKPDTIWTLPQLLWLKENERDTFEKISYLFFEKDYIRYFLTGVFCTDYIEAEGSMLFDCRKLCWDTQLLGLVGVKENTLPKIVSPLDVIGEVTEEASKLTGLSKGTKVICGTTDTVMEVFAAGAVNRGDMTVKLATAGRICVITDKPYPNRNLINYSHIANNLWYPGTATKSAASSLRWYRDTFDGDYKEFDEDAKSVPIGADGLIFHPYLKGELTPYANPNLSASFIGVKAHHTKAHFTRAVLEGVALSMLDCIKTLDSMDIKRSDKGIVIGGGAKSPLWRQILSDALGIKLVTMKNTDSSFGSAMLAGVATGVFKDFNEALKICNEEVYVTYPDAENTLKYDELFKKYKAVQKALEPIYNGDF